MSKTGIHRCRCDSPFQDEQYGSSIRVHNVKKDGTGVCTVCLDQKGSMFKPVTVERKSK
jgi:hypothetical protein